MQVRNLVAENVFTVTKPLVPIKILKLTWPDAYYLTILHGDMENSICCIIYKVMRTKKDKKHHHKHLCMSELNILLLDLQLYF